MILSGGQRERGGAVAPLLEEEEAPIPVPVPAGGGRPPPGGPPGPPGGSTGAFHGELLSVRLARGPLEEDELASLRNGFARDQGPRPGERRVLADVLVQRGSTSFLLWRPARWWERPESVPRFVARTMPWRDALDAEERRRRALLLRAGLIAAACAGLVAAAVALARLLG